MTTKSSFLTLCAIATLATTNLALANDTSFANINVNEIQTNAKVGTEINFTGEEARALMKVLPAINSVMGKTADSHFRHLAIFSPGYMVNISCNDAQRRDGTQLITPTCQIYFGTKVAESEGFKFEPETQCH